MKDKKCGRAKKHIPHSSHIWIAGDYFPIGAVDGYPARCPGVAEPEPVGVSRQGK